MNAEVSQLCIMTYEYQRHVQNLKQLIFNDVNFTDDVLSHLFGLEIFNSNSEQQGVNAKCLHTFINKNFGILNNKLKDRLHNSDISISVKDCELITHRYSEFRDGILRKKQLWSIFRPLHLSCPEQIMKCRKSKKKFSEYPAIHYKTKDAIIQILIELIQFQKTAEEMRYNIKNQHQTDQQHQIHNFQLTKVTPEHLQAYISQYSAQLKISDCRIVIEHILGHNPINKSKIFYLYFIPNYFNPQKSNQKNPIEKLIASEKDQDTMNNTYDHFNKSTLKWNYGNYYKRHKKPLYLK